jgi:hypothetical protein
MFLSFFVFPFLQTFWLEFKGESPVQKDEPADSTSFSEEESRELSANDEDRSLFKMEVANLVGSNGVSTRPQLSAKVDRLVDWNVDLLTTLLKEIVARRESNGTVPESDERLTAIENEPKDVPLSEVQEIIRLPAFRRGRQSDPAKVSIDKKAVYQLNMFIVNIAGMYHDNRKNMMNTLRSKLVDAPLPPRCIQLTLFLLCSVLSFQLSTTLSMPRMLPCLL